MWEVRRENVPRLVFVVETFAKVWNFTVNQSSIPLSTVKFLNKVISLPRCVYSIDNFYSSWSETIENNYLRGIKYYLLKKMKYRSRNQTRFPNNRETLHHLWYSLRKFLPSKELVLTPFDEQLIKVTKEN